MSLLYSDSPSLPCTPPSSSRSYRAIPLSPLNPFRRDDNLTTTTTTIPTKATMSSPPGSPYGGPMFPPPLGSSSPPLPSPTPTPTNPYFLHPPSSPSSVFSAATSSRATASGPSFASRARARQPLPPNARTMSSADPHSRWGPRPSLGRHSHSVMGYTSFGESVDAMTEKSIKGTMWRDKFRQQCLELKQDGVVKSSRRQTRVGLGLGKIRGNGKQDAPRLFDPAVEDDDMADGTDDEDENEEIFRRMMQKQKRQLAHQAKVQYEREVGGSDPAVLEMDIREAEAEAQAESEARQRQASTLYTSPTSSQPLTQEQPGTIWRYRPTPARDRLTLSTPMTEGTDRMAAEGYFLNTGSTRAPLDSVERNSSRRSSDYPDPDELEVDVDEMELARLAQMEEEEKAMIDRFGSGFRSNTEDVFLDGLTWEDLEPDEDELANDDVEMAG